MTMEQDRLVKQATVQREGDESADESKRPASIGGLPYPSPLSGSSSHAVRANPSRDTRPEQRLRSRLHRDGLRFRKNFAIQLLDRRVRPDIVFTRRRVAVFVDGCFWHRCPRHGTSPKANAAYWIPKLNRNVARDRIVDQALMAAGWTVVRIWEHESLDEAANTVASVLRSQPGSFPRR